MCTFYYWYKCTTQVWPFGKVPMKSLQLWSGFKLDYMQMSMDICLKKKTLWHNGGDMGMLCLLVTVDEKVDRANHRIIL